MIELRDFENGLCPGVHDKSYQRNKLAVGRVQQWINDGLLFEPGTNEPSALMGWLHLTKKGKERLGIVDAVPVRETQRGLFDE